MQRPGTGDMRLPGCLQMNSREKRHILTTPFDRD
ncbi:hypothetical protein SAMN05428979_0314 [Stappia sp. ES.058]|nr:hypothetical protein SAMN05428979_0314 [Stappia sp. ES.058]